MKTIRLIHTLLDESAFARPDACAVRDAVGDWSYGQLAQQSRAFERWLSEQGVGHGDRVVVQLPSTRELVAMFFGTSRRGAIFVPLNPGMKPYHLRTVLENAAPELIIAADAAADTLRGVTAVPVHGLESVWRGVQACSDAPARTETSGFGPDSIAALIYTSGSTATPKAVVCPHAQVIFAASAIRAELGYRPGDVIFCRFPLSWDYGLYKVLLSCLGQSELILADSESDLVLLKRIRETGATVVPIVPSLATMITRLAKREKDPAPRVRMFTNTGAALTAATIGELRSFFPGARIVRQFGQTECKRISIMPPEMDEEKPGSVGRPLPGTKVLILDSAGEPVPTGCNGEIVVTGPHVMPGYWRSPEQSARAFRLDSVGVPRLHTGDYGHLDEDGYLYFEGRRDDMFKHKGIRMSTIEIEAAAMDIPGVRAAAALPPNGGRGLALCAQTHLAPHEVLRELAKRLETAKVPSLCRTVDELPLTLHGKYETKALEKLFDASAQ
jgi:acyl-coenzyme A synthetase/AMP-(fatty) acid ligase